MIKQHVPFTNIKEHFSEYEAENGQTLKFKLVLTDIVVETREDGEKGSFLEFKDVGVVITDVKIDTSGFEYANTNDVTDKDHVKELKFRAVDEVVNIYETQKALIFVLTFITNVYLTNKKDKSGNPILRYKYDKRISAIDKSEIRAGPSP